MPLIWVKHGNLPGSLLQVLPAISGHTLHGLSDLQTKIIYTITTSGLPVWEKISGITLTKQVMFPMMTD